LEKVSICLTGKRKHCSLLTSLHCHSSVRWYLRGKRYGFVIHRLSAAAYQRRTRLRHLCWR